jgi:hypothetical protein
MSPHYSQLRWNLFRTWKHLPLQLSISDLNLSGTTLCCMNFSLSNTGSQTFIPEHVSGFFMPPPPIQINSNKQIWHKVQLTNSIFF